MWGETNNNKKGFAVDPCSSELPSSRRCFLSIWFHHPTIALPRSQQIYNVVRTVHRVGSSCPRIPTLLFQWKHFGPRHNTRVDHNAPHGWHKCPDVDWWPIRCVKSSDRRQWWDYEKWMYCYYVHLKHQTMTTYYLLISGCPVPTYLAFNCSVEMEAPPGLLILCQLCCLRLVRDVG